MLRNSFARLAGIVTLLTLLATVAAGLAASPALAKAPHARTVKHTRCATTRHPRRRHHRVATTWPGCGPKGQAITHSSAGPSASTTTLANTFGPSMFGVAAGGAFQNEDPATLAGDLSADRSVGAKWLRIDINWAQIQAAGPTIYNWTNIDAVVQGAESRGMNVLGVIVYTPSWDAPAGASATYGPSPASYAAFAAVAVARYSAMGVHAYEIWNEENSVAAWTPAPSPSAYAALLKAAYPVIKAADPTATVVTGGLAPAPTDGTDYAPVDFLQGVYAAGGQGSFDAVGAHPYCWPAMPGDTDTWSAWYQMYGTAHSLRSVMVANGDGDKNIWATEFGAPTDGPAGSYVSQATQAAMITRAYQLWAGYSWAGPLFTYQGRDQGTDPSTNENFYGFINNDGTPKPAFAAYQQAVAAVSSG